MRIIRCSKCSKEYKDNKTFEEIAKDNDLKCVGNKTFYCSGCLPNLAAELTAKGAVAKTEKLRFKNKQVISNEHRSLT